MPNNFSKFFNERQDLEREIRRPDGSAPQDGDFVVFDEVSGNLMIVAGGSSIDRLSDVDTTTDAPVNGDILIWNPNTGEWVPGSSNSFIDVPTYPFQVIPRATLRSARSMDRTTATLTATIIDADQPPTEAFAIQWLDPDGMVIDGATETTYMATESGTYTIIVQDVNGNQDRETITIALNIAPESSVSVAAQFTADDMVTGTFSVSDADHPDTVAWTLSYNGTQISAGMGAVTNQAFSVDNGGVGMRNVILRVADPDGATSTQTVPVEIIQPNRTATFVGTNNITGPTDGYNVQNLMQPSQSVQIGAFYNFLDITATVNPGYQIDTAFTTSGDALVAAQVDAGATVNRAINGAVSAIQRTVTFTVVNQIAGPTAGYTISHETQASQTGIIGGTWSFLQPTVTANAGYTLDNINISLTSGALTGTFGATAPDNIVITITGTVTATTQTARLSLSGTVANVSTTGGTFSDSGTIGEEYTLVLPTITPDPGYSIGTVAYGGGSGQLTGTFGASDISVSRVLSGTATAIQRRITFTVVNNINGPTAGYTLTNDSQAAQTRTIGQRWSFNQVGFTIGAAYDGNITVTVTSGALSGTVGATAPPNVVVTLGGNVRLAPVAFTATGTYNGGTFSSAGGTPSTSDFTTNQAGPLSVTSIASNAATDGQSRLDSTNLGTSGGTSSTGAFGACGSLTPATTQVFTGMSYTASGTQSATVTVSAVTRSTRYTNTQTVAPRSTSQRTQTVTLRGTIPTGASPPFTDAGDPSSVQVSITQAGDTASSAPSRRAPCGTLAVGRSCTDTTTVTPSSTSTTSQACTSTLTGTGTLSVSARASSSTVDVGSSVTFSATTPVTNYVGSLRYSYTWTLSGGGLSGTRTGSSISVTPTAAGTVTASLRVTAPGQGGSTFSATASASTTAEQNDPCATVTASATVTGCTVPSAVTTNCVCTLVVSGVGQVDFFGRNFGVGSHPGERYSRPSGRFGQFTRTFTYIQEPAGGDMNCGTGSFTINRNCQAV